MDEVASVKKMCFIHSSQSTRRFCFCNQLRYSCRFRKWCAPTTVSSLKMIVPSLRPRCNSQSGIVFRLKEFNDRRKQEWCLRGITDDCDLHHLKMMLLGRFEELWEIRESQRAKRHTVDWLNMLLDYSFAFYSSTVCNTSAGFLKSLLKTYWNLFLLVSKVMHNLIYLN